MWDKIPKIYCICTLEREDRYQECLDEFTSNNILNYDIFRPNKIENGSLGCFRSHMNVVKKIIDNNKQFINFLLRTINFAYNIRGSENNFPGPQPVSIEKKDYENKVGNIIKDYKTKINLPGFRKGHVPLSLIRKKYEKAIIVEETNKILKMNDKINSV